MSRYRRLLARAREAEERWRSVIKDPFDFVCVVDCVGVYQYVNHTAPGVSMEGLIGKGTIYDHLATDHHEVAKQALDKVFSSASAAHFEAYSPPPVDAWFSTVVSPVRHDGEVVSASLLARDITQLKVAEAARRESEKRFQQLAESIDDVFYLLDPKERRLLYLSPAYQKMWGRPAAALEGNPRDWQDAIHPEDRKEVLAHLRDALHREDLSLDPIEYRVLHADGSIRWLRHRAYAVQDGSPASRRIAGIVTDITEQRRSLHESRHARAFSLRLLEAQEAERASLARELHDEFGQNLTGLKLLLATASGSGSDPQESAIRDATDIVSGMLRRVRARSLDLRPAMLDDLGLLPALLALFRSYTRQTHVLEWRGVDKDGVAVGSGVYYYQLYLDGATLASPRSMSLLK